MPRSRFLERSHLMLSLWCIYQNINQIPFILQMAQEHLSSKTLNDNRQTVQNEDLMCIDEVVKCQWIMFMFMFTYISCDELQLLCLDTCINCRRNYFIHPLKITKTLVGLTEVTAKLSQKDKVSSETFTHFWCELCV